MFASSSLRVEFSVFPEELPDTVFIYTVGCLCAFFFPKDEVELPITVFSSGACSCRKQISWEGKHSALQARS